MMPTVNTPPGGHSKQQKRVVLFLKTVIHCPICISPTSSGWNSRYFDFISEYQKGYQQNLEWAKGNQYDLKEGVFYLGQTGLGIEKGGYSCVL